MTLPGCKPRPQAVKARSHTAIAIEKAISLKMGAYYLHKTIHIAIPQVIAIAIAKMALAMTCEIAFAFAIAVCELALRVHSHWASTFTCAFVPDFNGTIHINWRQTLCSVWIDL